MRIREALSFGLLLLLVSCVTTAREEGEQLTLDMLHGAPGFDPEGFGPARWLEDGSGYTTLEATESEAGGRDVVRYDPATGARAILVSAAQLVPEGGGRPLPIADYTWSSDGRRLLIFTNTRRVWRRNTRGDYWVLDRETGKLRQLGAEFPEATMMFAKFSPDGRHVAYVQWNDLWVEETETGELVRLTFDGSATIINGTFDWVYEEEFHLRDGFRWSPDGERIAFWQLDTEGVGVFYMVDNLSGPYARLIPVQYPKVGTTNSACRVGVIDAEGGDAAWLQLEGDPRENYIARMEWAASSDEVVIQYLNRLQNTNQVMLGHADTGEVRTMLTETDKTWTEVVTDLRWMDDGASFTWVSERTGWRHAYLASRKTGEMRPITEGDYDVISIQSIDEESGWLHFIASPDDPKQRYLFRARLDGTSGPERLTPAAQPGTHSYQISPSARWAIHTYSAFGRPPVIDLVRLPEHEVVRTIVDSAELVARYEALDRGPFEFFRVDIGDGVELDGWCMKPPGFDPSKRYPVLMYVYGEPWGQTVLDVWGGDTYLWHLMLTQRGYVVMSVDNRGTSAPRGREWRKCIYRQIGILASAEQAAAVGAICERWSWVDRERIASWGWSGGGSMTLNAMFRYPELYHTGMAVAPVPNELNYDTIYQERYMGLPDDNAEGYREGSPVTFAHQLEGNLLVVHGTTDDNCHYQGTEQLIDTLIAAGKHFTMMAYPSRSHSLHERAGTRKHLYALLARYLEENMPVDESSR